MAIALHSFKVDEDGRIRVQHIFYGEDQSEAEEMMAAHADICPKFGPAVEKGNTIEVTEDIDSLPTPDTVDDFVAGDPDDDDEEEDEQ